ncbi:TPA: type III secretion system translocon subunit SctE [Providencia rettgeri]|nr:type III secretion system translocon subunit SctE [Providencia rettgeri]
MVDITGLGNSERIKNIHTFLQGSNPLGISEDSVKAVLALEEACADMASVEQMKSQRNENIPKLLKPRMMAMKMSPQTKGAQQDKGFNSTALLIESFSTLRQLLHEGNLSELKSRLQLLNIESDSIRNKGNELLDVFSESVQQASDMTNEMENSKQKLNAAKTQKNELDNKKDIYTQSIESNKESLANTQNELAKNEAILTQLDALERPITEETHENKVLVEANIAKLNIKINQLGNERKELDEKLSLLSNSESTLISEINTLQNDFEILLDKATELAKISDDNRQQLSQFIESAPRKAQVDDGEKWENTLAVLTLLTAQLKKAMNEDSIRNMKEQEEVMSVMSEASRKDSDKKAKEAEEAQRKADEANKAASCASKILSYVMLAVSVVATVATFGAAAPLTLAVAAIGIAIAVADIVLEETGQSSLMQMLATEISNAVTDMLISFGVPEEKAKQIGSIVGMVVAAIAFLVLSLASMSSFVKNIASIATKAVKMLAKNAGKLLKTVIKSMPNSLTNALGKVANSASKVGKSTDDMVVLTKFTKLADNIDDLQQTVKTTAKIAQKADDMKDIAKAVDKTAASIKTQSSTMARLEVGMKGTGAALTVTNTAVTGGLNLHAAAQIRDMKEMLAGMMLNSETIQALDELLKSLLKSMSQNYEQFEEMFSGMLTSLNQSGQAKANTLKAASFA